MDQVAYLLHFIMANVAGRESVTNFLHLEKRGGDLNGGENSYISRNDVKLSNAEPSVFACGEEPNSNTKDLRS